MSSEFERFMREEVKTMVREIGGECVGDTERLNRKALAWIEANAARFRAEWVRTHTLRNAQEWGEPCSGAN
jgi:hypothetical protein